MFTDNNWSSTSDGNGTTIIATTPMTAAGKITDERERFSVALMAALQTQ
jgi:hypothetical protein